jgi:hypothetical protein
MSFAFTYLEDGFWILIGSQWPEFTTVVVFSHRFGHLHRTSRDFGLS